MSLQSLFGSFPGAIDQGLVWGIMAIGVYLSYRILDYADLTVDGSFCTGGAVAAVLIVGGMNPLLALLFALLAGMAAGLVTGLLHTLLGIPSILSGILTQLALYSLNLHIMGKSNTTISRTKYNLLLTSFSVWKSMAVTVIAVVIVIAVLYWFFGTEVGCAVRATGNNLKMARAQGINVDMMKVLGLILSNGLVGLSGGILAQFEGSADVNMGRGAIVIGLAAVVIGEALAGKKHNFAVTLGLTAIGAVVYFIVQSIVLWLGLNTVDLKLFSAVTVAIFLAVPYVKNKYSTKDFFKKNIKFKSKH